MSIWPFKRRRKSSHNDAAAAEQHRSTSVTTPPPAIPRRSSRRNSTRGRSQLSKQDEKLVDAQQFEKGVGAPQNEKAVIAQSPTSLPRPTSPNKENVPPRPVPPYSSREDITALPRQEKLEQSPHLRPIDLSRPQIPYNFHSHAPSETSIQRQDAYAKLTKTQTMRSKRSTTEYGTPSRKTSSKSKPEKLREEEIRAMAAPIPIPKRPGEGPLRRDSKKIRSLSGGSNVSLPAEGSVHSSMSGVLSQRGWEIGSLAAVFSPRPNVRLSGTPQYVVSGATPEGSSGYLYRIDSLQEKGKAPTAERRKGRKRRTVGTEADDLGASDLRTLMDRDSKRREKRQQERQEVLERKLREKASRDRVGSGKKRLDSTERRGVEDAKARADERLQSRGILTPPSDVHPALRDSAAGTPTGVGLGIDPREAEATPQTGLSVPHQTIDEDSSAQDLYFTDAEDGIEPRRPVHEQTIDEDSSAHDPFTDAEEVLPSPSREPAHDSMMEEPVYGTAQAVRMPQAQSHPLSPVYVQRIGGNISQTAEDVRQESVSHQSITELQPPPAIPEERRGSDPPQERRGGTWANIFRRGGTFRRSSQDAQQVAANSSFSNTSRESMRNQPIPAHLVGTDYTRAGGTVQKPGTPTRTTSKFREELPEMPESPPDSSLAAAITAAQSADRKTPQPVDIPGRLRDQESDPTLGGRTDTPTSQFMRGHGAMTGSLASIDSEASWLAGGNSAKRQSNQSALSRSFSKRNPSFEELGMDKDAEYLSRNAGNSGTRSRGMSNAALIGASPDEESDEDGPAPAPSQEPLTVHDSVRRRPTLVQRDPRLVSREGLVQEYVAQEPTERAETPYEGSLHGSTGDEDSDFEPLQVERATSVQYASRHSRQFSAGSAKLLDVPPTKSVELGRPNAVQEQHQQPPPAE